jgi:peptidoglycan/LPS O-acetylase OafA/YrhL
VPRWPMLLRAIAFVIAAGFWIYAVMGPGVKSYDAHTTVAGAIGGWLLVLLGSMLFLLAVLGIPESYVPRWLSYLGRISYGLYIFHSLLFHLVFEAGERWMPRRLVALYVPASVVPAFGTTLVLVLCIASAALSYRYFERPFLKLKQRFTFVHSRPE